MGVCENHIIFGLVFHFHPPWAFFSFHNPVALVCGGYVMMLSDRSDSILFEIQSECLDRSQSNMSNFWIPPAIWTTSETTSERHPKSSQVIIDPFDPFWFSFLIWILRRRKKRQEYSTDTEQSDHWCGKNNRACRLHCRTQNPFLWWAFQTAGMEDLYPV